MPLRLLCSWLQSHPVFQSSEGQPDYCPERTEAFDVRSCGKESAKPASSKEAVGAWKQIHDSNRAVLERFGKIRIQRISQSSSQHLGTHTGNGVLHGRSHFTRCGGIHHQPAKNPGPRSATKKGSPSQSMSLCHRMERPRNSIQTLHPVDSQPGVRPGYLQQAPSTIPR
jgi:hypothetical protein